MTLSPALARPLAKPESESASASVALAAHDEDARVVKLVGQSLEQTADYELSGRVLAARGLRLEIGGLSSVLAVGDRCRIQARDRGPVVVEVVGFQGKTAVAMPLGDIDGIGVNARATVVHSMAALNPHNDWLGRVINPFGQPIDGKGSLPVGSRRIYLRQSPPPAHTRDRVGDRLDTGVRAINAFLTLCRGQRMGIFAGSGVGKSMLLAQIARFCGADVVVIGLIGERGREVREFIEDYLGEEGLSRSVVVVASSDEAALVRRDAAYATVAVAEHFRDQGRHVLCLMDSITRFAMAQREIGLSAGEPPATKGYTPGVFAELPRVLERCGPGVDGCGSITTLATVLVEGDDMNEPVSDAVRGILDGHIVLSRSIANRGRFPSIDVLQSVSRMVPACNNEQENQCVARGRSLLSTYSDMEELVRLGAYRRGADAQVDEAVRLFPALDGFIAQKPNESVNLAESYRQLSQIVAASSPPAKAPAVAGVGVSAGGTSRLAGPVSSGGANPSDPPSGNPPPSPLA